MSVQVVIKQIQREAAANKGKAVVLAVVCAVALYFWVPLLSGWFSGTAGTGDQSLVVAPQADAASTPAKMPAVAIATAEHDAHAWYDVAHWMASDPLMTSATLPARLRDPFQQSRLQAEEPHPDELAEVEAPQPPARLDLAHLGIDLTSTMVGRNRAVIQVSGKSLAVPIDARGRPAMPTVFQHTQGGVDYQFAVLSVQPGVVVLQHEDETYELRMRRAPAVQDSIQFLWTRN